MLSDFLTYLWVIPTEELRKYRDSWALMIWKTVSESKDQALISKFLIFLAARHMTLPAQFMGAFVWALRNVKNLNSRRIYLIRHVLQIAEFFGEQSSITSFPLLDVQAWDEQSKTLRWLFVMKAI